jgi:hypothetical protein
MSPLLSPLHFPQPFPAPVMNNINSPHIQPIQNTPTPRESVLFSPHAELTLYTAQNIQPNNQPLFLNSPATTVPPNDSLIPPVSPSARSSALPNRYFPKSSENSRFSSYTKAFLKITLPSTKDIPLLTGKHDWGPWHTVVWTLIDCSNLLGHIHESMLPGALYDPDLEPLFPPVIMWESSQCEKDIYSDWWNHDKVAVYILTSRLSPAALGTIPIANSQLSQCRSARTIYVTLKNNYGAGDYSAVMAIEA